MQKIVFTGRKGDNHRYSSETRNIEIHHSETNEDGSTTLYMYSPDPFSITYIDTDGNTHEIFSSIEAW